MGGFHSRSIDRETFGGQVYAYIDVLCFVEASSTYNKHLTRSDNRVLFRVDLQQLNVSRD